MISYISYIDAEQYFEGQLNTQAWDNASVEDRERALNMATAYIDTLPLIGRKATTSQELRFPREGQDEVPLAVQHATARIALRLLEGVDPDMERRNLSMSAQGYASLKQQRDTTMIEAHTEAGVIDLMAWRLLAPYLRRDRHISLARSE